MISIRESGELYSYCLVYLLNNNKFLKIISVNSNTILVNIPGISGLESLNVAYSTHTLVQYD